MDIYFERIKPLIDATGKDHKEIERELSLPKDAIYNWNHKVTKSYTKFIAALAKYLHVSVDYLMGTSDDPHNMTHAKEQLFEMVKDSPSMPSGDRLSFLFDKLDYDPMVIAHNLDIDQYHMNSWVLHNNLPPRPIVDKISACVQMKPIELLNSDEFVHYSSEEEDFGPVSDDVLSADELSVIKKYRLLDRYGKEAVDGILDVEWRRCKPPVEEQAGISVAARKSDEPHAATGPDTDVEI